MWMQSIILVNIFGHRLWRNHFWPFPSSNLEKNMRWLSMIRFRSKVEVQIISTVISEGHILTRQTLRNGERREEKSSSLNCFFFNRLVYMHSHINQSINPNLISDGSSRLNHSMSIGVPTNPAHKYRSSKMFTCLKRVNIYYRL